MNHPNSKKITIFRTGTFISRAQGKEAQEYFAQSKAPIGSYWESANSQKVGSGLSFKEESLLLPLIIDTPKDDKEFRKKVTEFYNEISTDVPFGTGVTLEVGLEEDNAGQISEKNMPIKLMDYLRYRHAQNHPKVAATKELADGNQLVDYYIFDKDNVQAKNTKKVKERDAAMQIYLEVKNEESQVDQMLTLLGVDPREYATAKDKANLKTEKLRELADADPSKFVEAHSSGDLEIRAWITNMVTVGVLKKIGQKYMDGETNEIIGNSLEETIFFFKDEEKSGEITVLKARMQEGLKKPIVKEGRRTIVS
jgi:hypothetical protein